MPAPHSTEPHRAQSWSPKGQSDDIESVWGDSIDIGLSRAEKRSREKNAKAEREQQKKAMREQERASKRPRRSLLGNAGGPAGKDFPEFPEPSEEDHEKFWAMMKDDSQDIELRSGHYASIPAELLQPPADAHVDYDARHATPGPTKPVPSPRTRRTQQHAAPEPQTVIAELTSALAQETVARTRLQEHLVAAIAKAQAATDAHAQAQAQVEALRSAALQPVAADQPTLDMEQVRGQIREELEAEHEEAIKDLESFQDRFVEALNSQIRTERVARLAAENRSAHANSDQASLGDTERTRVIATVEALAQAVLLDAETDPVARDAVLGYSRRVVAAMRRMAR